ncbi:MAG: serine/threonine protein kinase [Pirellulaceae bacterium]|nr:serine/threonine protein kinase [Pirellulaceae bacterium]
MPLLCPHCQHSMVVKDAKPGKYKPKCAKCGERFSLTVFPDASQEPLVQKLPAEAERPNIANAPTVLYPPSAEGTAVPESPLPAGKTVAPNPQVEATIVSTPPPTAKGPASAAPSLASSEKTVGGGVEATAMFDTGSAATMVPTGNSAAATMAIRGTDATAPGNFGGVTRADQAPATYRASGPASGGVPPTIGGYKIVKELGRGAMGAVYLARQASLDRDVALKTIQAQYADNPTFIARFTREAYAAAQLTHHNVVQIYDLGHDNGTNYFSMEFVRGQSLDEVVRKEGKLDPEVAVGYILQAARGLQYAHDHGMVHRDVKPANMMINENGIVKVADLGLVKTPAVAEAEAAAEARENAVPGDRSASLAAATANVTLNNVAMGTPAYMAPEQAANAAGVDHRADIYSLGCSLYVLLTGRPPFEGATALEVITKHKTEPVVRPEAIVKRVPPRLSEICLKMVAKRPEDRYAALNEVIKDLEGFLGVQSSGTYSPKEEHAQLLEGSVKNFNSAPMTKLRGILPLALFGLLAVQFLVWLMFHWGMAISVLTWAVITPAAYFVISGLRQRTYLFEKARGFVFSARITDWLTWIGSGLVFLLALWLLGSLWYWLGFAILAVGLAAGYSFVVDDGLARQRKEPLEKMEQLLKSLRLKGVDENSIRSFVARYSGDNWEEFFEALFNYEAKLAARDQFGRGDSGRTRKKFRGWRDAVIRWMDDRLRAEKERKERQHLQNVEEKNLQAQGVDVLAARKQAQAMADVLMDEAEHARQEPAKGGATVIDPKAASEAKRQRIKQMLAEARRGAYQPKKKRMLGLATSPLTFALGGKMRFLLGCLLIAAFAMWVKMNPDVFKFGQIKDAATNLAESVKSGDVKAATDTVKGSVAESSKEAAGAKDLPIPVLGPILSGWPAGIAGLMLVVLGLFQGWKMSIFALPAAALILFGSNLGIPGGELMAIPIGLAIAGIGFFFGRTADP